MSASLIGRLGQVFSDRRRRVDVARRRVFLVGINTKPSIMGFEDEVEQSFGRPCRQTDGRSNRK
jgi:hypothetical protein